MHALLAVDGSSQSISAVRFFASLPFRSKPKCTIVTALMDSQFDLVTDEAGLQIREVENEEAREAFEAARAILGPISSSVEHKLQRQHPSQLILDSAKELDVDLIVLGSLGHSALYRMTIGSTADYVANHAKCSTLVVRGGADKPEAPAGDHFRIMLACDDSDGSRRAYEQLRSFAWCESKAEIHMTRLLERPKLLPEDEIYDPQLMAEKKQKLEEMRQSAFADCNVTTNVEETIDIASALQTRVERLGTDLLFVGDSTRSGLKRFFLGSTSRYLLHHTHCSLWIARQKQWS